jgi:FKBP-type peptidyl-prolyl cis-trans isomerase SlpA
MNPAIEPGSRVSLHFRLSLADGTLAEASAPGEPWTVTLGRGDLLEALERCLLGLRAGEHRRYEIPALEAYGSARDDAIHTLPRSAFPPELGVEVGQVIGFTTPVGDEIPGRVQDVTETEVTVDFCHPLAGHDLVFEVEILAVEPGA